VKLYDINGRPRSRKVSKYLISWRKKSKSKLQFSVKKFLQPYWRNHIVYEEFPVYGTRMKVDFINATKKIAVEVNGPQHDAFHKFFHGNSRAKYLQSIKRDTQKAQWLEKNNFILMQIYEDDIKSLSTEYIKETFGVSLV